MTIKIFFLNLQTLKKNYKFDAFIGFNFEYFAEIDLHKVCNELNSISCPL